MFLFNGDWTIRSNSTWSKKKKMRVRMSEDETGRGSTPVQLPCASSSSALQQMAVQPNEGIYERITAVWRSFLLWIRLCMMMIVRRSKA